MLSQLICQDTSDVLEILYCVLFSLHHLRLRSDVGRAMWVHAKSEGKDRGTFKTEESIGFVFLHEGSDTYASFPNACKGSVQPPSDSSFFLPMA